MADEIRFAVFAGSMLAARNWATSNGVEPGAWFYADRAERMRGYHPGQCIPVLAEGFWSRSDSYRLADASRMILGAQPAPVALGVMYGPLPREARPCRWCRGTIMPVTIGGLTRWVHRGADARWDQQSCCPGRTAVPEE